MSLIPWHPLKELETLRTQMNRLFDEWIIPESNPSETTWTPAIELKETDADIVLKVEVPGMEAKDLDVQVMENAVSIAGHHQTETHTESQGRVQSELRYGRFQRWIPLPVVVQHEQVKATFQNGMLTLTLPKVEAPHLPVTKVNLEEQLRQSVTQQRLHEEHRQDTVHMRAEDALERVQEDDLDQAAREAVTQERQHEEQRQDTAHMRATTGES